MFIYYYDVESPSLRFWPFGHGGSQHRPILTVWAIAVRGVAADASPGDDCVGGSEEIGLCSLPIDVVAGNRVAHSVIA